MYHCFFESLPPSCSISYSVAPQHISIHTRLLALALALAAAMAKVQIATNKNPGLEPSVPQGGITTRHLRRYWEDIDSARYGMDSRTYRPHCSHAPDIRRTFSKFSVFKTNLSRLWRDGYPRIDLSLSGMSINVPIPMLCPGITHTNDRVLLQFSIARIYRFVGRPSLHPRIIRITQLSMRMMFE